MNQKNTTIVGSANHSAHQKKWAYYVGISRNVYQNMHSAGGIEENGW